MSFFVLHVYVCTFYCITSQQSCPKKRKQYPELQQQCNELFSAADLALKKENYPSENFQVLKGVARNLRIALELCFGSCSFRINSWFKSFWTLLHFTQILELLLAFCSVLELRHTLRQAILEPAGLPVSGNTRLVTRSKSFEPSVVALVHLSNQPLEGSEDCSGLALQLFKEIFEVPWLITEFKELLSSSYFSIIFKELL